MIDGKRSRSFSRWPPSYISGTTKRAGMSQHESEHIIDGRLVILLVIRKMTMDGPKVATVGGGIHARS